MNVVFLSNFMNHHQVSVSDELFNTPEICYWFIETEELPKEKRELGYPELSGREYIIKAYISEDSYKAALEIVNSADVAIIGSAPEDFVIERIKAGKLTFRYSERLFKQHAWYYPDPRIWFSNWKQHIRYRNKPLYMLAASAYTANDVYAIGAYRNRVYKWGYFPTVTFFPDEKSDINKNKISILWCARFLKWKHPELAIKFAKKLKDAGYFFHLDMIGTGEEMNKCIKLVNKLRIKDEVSFLGSMRNEDVLKNMNKHQIFISTSDKNEGWGAVINEAMSQGCAVVASSEIGAVPFLIRDGENGLIYKSNSLDSLYTKTQLLFDDEFRKSIAANALKTVQEVWNPKIAAKRLIILCEKLRMGQDIDFTEGPCSKAFPIKSCIR